MNRTKKLLSVLLCLLMVASVFSVVTPAAFAQVYTGTSGGISYSLDTDTGVLTLSKTDGGTGRSAGYTNSSRNRAPWYNQRSYIRTVVAESGVIELGDYLFYNCTNLTSVNFASTVDTIGSCCFRSCTGLTGVILPAGCSWFYKEIFLDCSSLKWAVLPANNYTNTYSGMIPDGTFSGCTSLESVYVGSGISSLDTKAFYNCYNLKGVIWASGTINSVGSNALYNVPSSCVFVSNSNLSSWCSSNGYAFTPNSGICSSNTNSTSNLTYNIDLSSRAISFSGSGDMNSKPWDPVKLVLSSVNFSAVDGNYSIMSGAFQGAGIESVVFDTTSNLTIGQYAFADLFRSTYWLNIPANTNEIQSKAFDGSGFNYITIASENINLASDAFTLSGYARFFGIPNSGVREFVESGKALGYNWHYYCFGDTHITSKTVVEPTCTEQGYSVVSCVNCDMSNEKTEYTDALGHVYEATGTNASNFLYRCKRCSETNLPIDAVTVNAAFEDAISHDNDNSAYYQSNYNGVADVLVDGYVNAKDFKLITEVMDRQDLTNKQTVINESTTYQTMEGFGASSAWWAQDTGSWENIDDITALLYNKETGIGLDIYRYNLGAGSNDDPQLYEVGKRARCFLQADGTYNWNNDPGAMATLASVKRNNPDLKVTLFCNSAPVSMTDNGKAYCSTGATSNLSESKYQAFSDYVVTCTEHFLDEGYNVTEVSPINEPEWGWAAWQNGDGSYSMNQEGCHWEPAAARTFYNNYFIPAITSNSRLNGNVEVSVWESGQLNHSEFWNNHLNYYFSSQSYIGERYGNYNQNIRNYVDALDTHSYWASTSDRQTVANQLKDTNYSAIKRVKCSEYCQMTNDGSTGVYDLIKREGVTNGLTIDYGIALADIMYQDLTILNAVEWDWWVGCGYGIYPDALVYINANNHSDVQTSKRLWTMGNYSKFIDIGAKRVSVSTQSAVSSNVEESAYLNPNGDVVVVYINKGTDNQFTYFDSSQYSTLETYITDENRDLAKVQNGYVDGKAVLIPARSVTTVVLHK